MLSPTALSLAVNTLRDTLADHIADIDSSTIFVTHPKDAVDQVGGDGKQYLNLFLYQVEWAGHPPDAVSEDPVYVRANCLITALATKETGGGGGGVSAGENDLRLIGEVLRVFHEHPVHLISDNGTQAHMQVVFHPLTLDDINHLWSNQGGVPYRLSVAYQLSLLPVPMAEAQDRSPRVASIGVDAHGDLVREPLPGSGFAITTLAPAAVPSAPDVTRTDWIPEILFWDAAAGYQRVLTVPVASVPDQVSVGIAGKPGENVTLVWERWSAQGDGTPWQLADDSQSVVIALDALPADPADASFAEAVTVPGAVKTKGQATLHARRYHTRPDGTVVRIVSNPLLLTVF